MTNKMYFVVNGQPQVICLTNLPWFTITESLNQLNHVMRKPVFGVFDQVRLKPACSASEASWSHEIFDLASIGITLSGQ